MAPEGRKGLPRLAWQVVADEAAAAGEGGEVVQGLVAGPPPLPPRASQ